MPELPAHPDLDQLRRRAKELLRAARAGDGAAVARLVSFDLTPTLAAAQLVVAREHGFASWPALKEAVDAISGTPLVMRRLRSVQEQEVVLDMLARAFGEDDFRSDPRFADLHPTFETDRTLRVAVFSHGSPVAAALATAGVGLRVIGVHQAFRRIGLGTSLMSAIEMEALDQGAATITLGGASEESRVFYRSLGFRGRRSMMQKGLPLSAAMRAVKVRQLRAALGDLDRGVVVPHRVPGSTGP